MSAPRRAAPTRLASVVVHQRLREQIIGGELEPGDAIPSERALAEQFGVNRHAVREALKRLQQAGLVTISQGGSTRVRDWRTAAGLEVLLDLAEHGAETPATLIRSVLEMRASIGIDAARRCAERAGEPARARIEADAAAVATTVEAGRAVESIAPYLTFWEQIVDGSGNLAYRLGLNSLTAALDADPGLNERLAPHDATALRALGTAISSGDAAGAGDAARRLLEPDIELAG